MTYAATVPAQNELGRIIGGGYTYQITPDDVLWLARAVSQEGGSHAATAWTYAQRLISRRSSSLRDLLLAHSQPINPKWRRDGEFCRPGGRYHGDQTYCSERQLARRDENATRPWSSHSESVRRTVVDFARARLANPVPRATDFANQTVSANFMRRHPDARVVLKAPPGAAQQNWYLSEGPSSAGRGASSDWPLDHVKIEVAGRSGAIATASAAPGPVRSPATAILILAVAGAGLLAASWVRR